MKEPNTDQHTVPRAYMRAWCDPSTSNGAFLWVFPKKGGEGVRQSPKSTLTGEDFYTLPGSGGERDLSVEHALRDVEQAFVGVRDGAIASRRPLDDREMAKVCEFVAAMTTRTKSFTQHHNQQWSAALDMMRRLEQTPAAGKARRAGVSSGTGVSMGIDQVQAMASLTAPINVATMVPMFASLLSAMRVTILETTSEPGFITSDAPCVWFDPETQFLPPPYNITVPTSPTIEAHMPVSPRQILVFTRRAHAPAYLAIDDVSVTEVNRMTRGYCHQSFIVSRNVTRPEWFRLVPD